MLPCYLDLDKYLCIKKQRTIRNDKPIAYNKKLYQSGQSNSNKDESL